MWLTILFVKKKLAVLNSTNKKTERLLERHWITIVNNVNVCPTGIDIVMDTNGMSIVPLVLIECDTIMDSVGLQRDLYDTLPDKLKKSSVQTATLE
jgi:hypothetical protein